MYKRVFAAAIAAGLIAMPLPDIQTATAQTTQTATTATTATTSAKPARQPSPGQIAARERQKKCGAEWKEAKAAGKIEKRLTWPKYWSACNKRLKSGG